jgi:hypothetical protein
VRQVLSAAQGRRQRYIERQGQDRRGCVIIPVVVTGGRLVECELDADGRVGLREVPSAVVAGPRSGEKPALVFVLTEQAVTDFAHSMLALAQRARAPDQP